MNIPLRLVFIASVWLTVSMAGAGPEGDETHGHGSPAPAEAQQTQQETCPVMIGNKIDGAIHSTYKGKQVYFCCLECKAAFDAAPEKYLDRLPQFAKSGSAEDRQHGFALGRLVRPLGIATLILLLTTASAGFFRRLKPRLLIKWHKRLAPATVIVALCHAILVLFFH